MPSKSPKQARLMAAAAHNPAFAKKVGIKQSVAKDLRAIPNDDVRRILEAFASEGLIYVPKPFQPRAEDRSVEVEVKGGSVKFQKLQVSPLRSIW